MDPFLAAAWPTNSSTETDPMPLPKLDPDASMNEAVDERWWQNVSSEEKV